MTNPEQRARIEIDRLLTAAGRAVRDVKAAAIHATLEISLIAGDLAGSAER
ncbi:MAG: hypothetical protein U1E89_16630 [Burkholderiaceae bacterium]